VPVAGVTRIGVDLPTELVRRVEVQAECMGVSRAALIETALMGLVREFEEIDAEEGRPCTCGSIAAHAQWCPFMEPTKS
jgi:metal-responsive CopG/Arc/MetJ family transcriptional regulator